MKLAHSSWRRSLKCFNHSDKRKRKCKWSILRMKKKLSLNISYRYLREQHNQLYTYNFDKGNLIKRTVLPGEAIKISGVNSSSSAQVPEKDTSPFGSWELHCSDTKTRQTHFRDIKNNIMDREPNFSTKY